MSEPTPPFRITHPVVSSITYSPPWRESSAEAWTIGALPYYEGTPVKITVKAAPTMEFLPERLAMWGRDGRKLIVKFEPPTRPVFKPPDPYPVNPATGTTRPRVAVYPIGRGRHPQWAVSIDDEERAICGSEVEALRWAMKWANTEVQHEGEKAGLLAACRVAEEAARTLGVSAAADGKPAWWYLRLLHAISKADERAKPT